MIFDLVQVHQATRLEGRAAKIAGVAGSARHFWRRCAFDFYDKKSATEYTYKYQCTDWLSNKLCNINKSLDNTYSRNDG